jgi:hypothetical protein
MSVDLEFQLTLCQLTTLTISRVIKVRLNAREEKKLASYIISVIELHILLGCGAKAVYCLNDSSDL